MKIIIQKWALALSILLGISLFGYSQILPSGFVMQKVSSFNFPVSLNFAPDGRIFVLEQEGFVRIMKAGVKLSTPFVQLDSVYSSKEKGLLGIAFDPDFNTNGYIYLYYTVKLEGNTVNGNPLPGTGDGSPVRNKIVRYTANGDVAALGSKYTVLDLDIIPGFLTNYNHDGGAMQFGPDGKLYLATGENTLWCPCYNEPFRTNCNGCSIAFPAKPSQDLTVFHGKMLRINSDGSAPTDNPFYNNAATGIAKKYIYTLGVRNPFSWHFRPGTNHLYLNDVGSGDDGNAREELNVITGPGKNYGYPIVEGIVDNPLYVDPIITYPHRIKSVSGSPVNDYLPGSTLAGCAITGGVFFTSTVTNWPERFQNKYYYMDFCDGWINMLDVDNGNTKSNFATGISGNLGSSSSGGWGSICLETGLDGQLYFLTRSQSAGVSGLYKIIYTPTITGISIQTNGGINSITVPGGTLPLIGSNIPTNGSSAAILWSVLPATNVSINSSGLLQAKAKGNGIYTITGVSEENSTFIASYVVTISGQNENSINISVKNSLSPNITIPGGTLALKALASPPIAGASYIWSVSGNAMINSLTGILTATGNGIVNVTVLIKNNTNYEKGIITITISGQELTNTASDKDPTSDFIIYPNPNSGIFTLKSPTYLGDVEIIVLNEAGQTLYSEFVPQFRGEKQMNLKHLKHGLFMVLISGKNGMYREMLLIQ